MSVMLDLDNPSGLDSVPDTVTLQRWLSCIEPYVVTETDDIRPQIIGLRVIDEVESARLNHDYRGRDYPTNVLSFGSTLPEYVLDGLEEVPIGDLAICAPVLEREAIEQGKSVEAHWAHILVHGVLHLYGFDHEFDNNAKLMETLEQEIMASLGFPDPYSASSI
jgi:probable rRNA maturation factor